MIWCKSHSFWLFILSLNVCFLSFVPHEMSSRVLRLQEKKRHSIDSEMHLLKRSVVFSLNFILFAVMLNGLITIRSKESAHKAKREKKRMKESSPAPASIRNVKTRRIKIPVNWCSSLFFFIPFLVIVLPICIEQQHWEGTNTGREQTENWKLMTKSNDRRATVIRYYKYVNRQMTISFRFRTQCNCRFVHA